MSARSRRLLGLFVLLALLGPLVVDWLWTSDEERVEAALDGMERALEARDADALAAWFSEEGVKTAHPIPFLPQHRSESLVESLRAGLQKLSGLSLDRDETKVEFPEEGRARVATRGIGWIDVNEGRFPFQFTLDVVLAAGADRRFLLASIENAALHPGIR